MKNNNTTTTHTINNMNLIQISSSDTKMPDGTPLKDITDYAPSDVLCGRGGGTNHHHGNNYWRALVAANKRLYISLPKKQKALVAKSIVHAIRSAAPGKPGGRFLQKDGITNLWSDIGDVKAAEKTSQALREGAPVIRSEMESAIEKGYLNVHNGGRGNGKRKHVLEPVDITAGPYKPGQLLPNGLITLDYCGVAAACSKTRTRLYKDGITDLSMAQQQAGINGRRDGGMVAQHQSMLPGMIGNGGNDPMMHAFQQFMGAKQLQTAVLPSTPTTAAAASVAQAPVAPQPNTIGWDKELIQLHQQQTQQSQQNANMAVAAAAASQKTNTLTPENNLIKTSMENMNTPTQHRIMMQSQQVQHNIQQAQFLLQQKNAQNQVKQAVAQAQQSYAQHQVQQQQQTQQLQNQKNLPTNNNNSVGMNQYQAVMQHLLSRDYPMPSSSSTATKTNATADASALAPIIHRDILKVFSDATASARNNGGPLGILATAATGADLKASQSTNPANNNNNSLSTPATGIHVNNRDIGYAAGAGGGGSKKSEITKDVALEIIRKERALREASANANATTGGLDMDNLSSLIHQRVLNNLSGAGNNNYSRLITQQQGGLNGLSGYSDLTRGLGRGGGGLGLTTSVGLAREAAAAGLAGGRGPMSLQNNSLPNSYLAQVQRDKNTNSNDNNIMGTTNTEAGTSSFQNLPDISSMSDDEIRTMLHKLRNESEQIPEPTKLQQYTSGSSFPNIRAYTELLRNESFLGEESLGGNGQRASALSLDKGQILSELELYKNLLGNNGNSNLSPPSLGGTESIALQKAIQDAMHYLERGTSGSNLNSTTQLESAESLGPTPLRPGVSATLAQMRIAALLNDHGSVNGTANQGTSGSDVTKRVFWVPTDNTSKLEEARLRNRFQSNSGEESKVDMTSSPRRGQSGGSLDDLCRAAGIHLELQNSLKLPKKNTKKKSKKKKKKKVSKLKPGKNDQSLLDDSDSDESGDDDKPMASLSTKRKRATSRSTSLGSRKGGKRPVKHRLLSTTKAKVDKGPSIQFKNDEGNQKTKDPQATNITTDLTSQPSFARVIESIPMTETTLNHGHSLAMSEISKVSSIHFKEGEGNLKTNDPQATKITTNLTSQSSFARVIASIPMTETTLNHGHSLAMSEISDHPSVPKQLDECQFDDASEEDEEGEGGIKEKSN